MYEAPSSFLLVNSTNLQDHITRIEMSRGIPQYVYIFLMKWISPLKINNTMVNVTGKWRKKSSKTAIKNLTITSLLPYQTTYLTDRCRISVRERRMLLAIFRSSLSRESVYWSICSRLRVQSLLLCSSCTSRPCRSSQDQQWDSMTKYNTQCTSKSLIPAKSY